MLKEITIENYKSLKNAKVEFKDGLNIIIGKNGSGKSNLLEFINNFFSLRPFRSNLRHGRRDFDYNFNYVMADKDEKGEFSLYIKTNRETKFLNERSPSYNISITLSKKYTQDSELNFQKEYAYSLPINNTEDRIQKNEVLSYLHPFRRALNEKVFIKFNIPDRLNWLATPGSYQIDDGFTLNSNSEYPEIELVLRFEPKFEYVLLQEKRSFLFENLVEDIRKLFFDSFEEHINSSKIIDNLNSYSPIENIRLNKNVNIYKLDDVILVENVLIEFKVNDNWVPWSYLSDGTKRLFYLIAEMSIYEDSLILIEEPELGIHPHQLFKLMQFIKQQSETKQIIISTHSPIVLDALKSDELDRITIAKLENGSSKFEKLTEDQIFHAKKYMTEVAELSYYWLHSDLEEND